MGWSKQAGFFAVRDFSPWADERERRAQAQAVELSLAEAHRQRGAQGAPAPAPARPRSGGAAALVPDSVLGLSAECAPPRVSCRVTHANWQK